MIRLLGAVCGQVKVQQQAVLRHAVHHAAAKGRILGGQLVPGQLGLQGGVRPGAVGPTGDQDFQRGITGRMAHSRPPPRFPLPPRARKISTNRSSCTSDISSAATYVSAAARNTFRAP